MTKTNLRSLSYRFFLIILLFAPLAFGTVENWSFLALETMTALCFVLLFLCYLLHRKSSLQIPGMLPVLLFIALLLLQIIPLPVFLVQSLAPATFAMYRPMIEVDPTIHFITLSLNPKATLLSLFTCSAYGLFYFVTIQHLTSPDRLKKTTTVIIVLGVIVAIEAILQKLTSPGTIYWFRDAPANAYPVGPWVYSNHFAGYMEMIFPLAIALFLYYRPRNKYDAGIRDRFVTIFTMPGANRYLLLAAGSVLMAVSILISLSRWGIITLCAAFLFFIIFSARATNERRIQWAILISLFIILLGTWLGWQPIIREFGKLWGTGGLNTSGRLPVYLDTLKIIQSFPIFGTGSGTFIHTYPAFRTLPGVSVFDHAHNDYLEMLANNGIVGFLLCGWFITTVLAHTIKKLFQRRERYSILITSGALTGMLALLFHSLADFQMYNGANGLYFFFLCGLAVSAVNTRIIYRSVPTFLRSSDSALRLLIPAGIAVLLLVFSPVIRSGIMLARTQISQIGSIHINPNIPDDKLKDIYRHFAKASKYDPLESYYFFRRATVSSLLDNEGTAQQEYLRACLLDPYSGAYLQQLALSLPETMNAQKDLLLSSGIRRDPLSPDRYLVYGKWLISSGKEDQAVTILREAINTVPSQPEKIIRYILDGRFNEQQIETILSVHPYAWYSTGRMLEKRKQFEEAERYYRQALDLPDNQEIRPEFFIRLYTLYQKQEKEGDAIKIVRRGAQYLPDHPWFRIQLGNIYHRRGVEYRALEEYRKALQLDPNNRALARKIWNLEHR